MNNDLSGFDGSALSKELGHISPTALQDAVRAVGLFGVTVEQAEKALLAFGLAAKKLEDESNELPKAHRTRQPWWRRGR